MRIKNSLFSTHCGTQSNGSRCQRSQGRVDRNTRHYSAYLDPSQCHHLVVHHAVKSMDGNGTEISS